MKFFTAFEEYPEEGMIVGRLVVGYGELEYDLMLCLSDCVGDIITAVRLLYRIRSESSRLEIADSLLRPYFKKYDLANEYSEVCVALKFCKTVRNAFAHSHWTPTLRGLFFSDLERAAESKDGGGMVRIRHIDGAILKQQEEYFVYCQEILNFLHVEAQRRNGLQIEKLYSMPKALQKPLLCTPPEKAPPFGRIATYPTPPK